MGGELPVVRHVPPHRAREARSSGVGVREAPPVIEDRRARPYRCIWEGWGGGDIERTVGAFEHAHSSVTTKWSGGCGDVGEVVVVDWTSACARACVGGRKKKTETRAGTRGETCKRAVHAAVRAYGWVE